MFRLFLSKSLQQAKTTIKAAPHRIGANRFFHSSNPLSVPNTGPDVKPDHIGAFEFYLVLGTFTGFSWRYLHSKKQHWAAEEQYWNAAAHLKEAQAEEILFRIKKP